MNNVTENENEKVKEIKKTSPAESFEDYEDDAMEASQESSRLGEEPVSETRVCPIAPPIIASITNAEDEPSCEETSVRDSYQERKQKLIRQKWMSLTGRKPRSVPTVKKFQDEEESKIKDFFGDRRPAEIEKNRIENWRKALVSHYQGAPIINYGKVRHEYRLASLSEGVCCVRFEQSGASLATSYRTGVVQVRNPFNLEVRNQIKAVEVSDKLPVRGLRYHTLDGSKLYLGGASGLIQVFDTETTNLIAVSENIKQINNLDISADGYFLVAVGRDGRVSLFDANTLQIISIRERPSLTSNTTSSIDDEYHRLRVYGVKFYPGDSNLFLTSSWDCTVKIWDVRIPEAIHSIRCSFLSGDSIDVRDNKILTASWIVEDSLNLWDFSTRKLIKTIPLKTRGTKYEGEFLYTAKFLDIALPGTVDRSELAVVGGNGFYELCVVNINTETIVASLPSYKAILTVDSLKNLVVYGGKESLLRLGEIVLPPDYESKKWETS